MHQVLWQLASWKAGRGCASSSFGHMQQLGRNSASSEYHAHGPKLGQAQRYRARESFGQVRIMRQLPEETSTAQPSHFADRSPAQPRRSYM